MTESDTPANEAPDAPVPSTPQSDAPADDASEQPSTPVEIGSEVASEEALEAPQAPTTGLFWGTGRRKSAVARVRLIPGEGKVLINKREVDDYFREPQERLAVCEPLIATDTEKVFNVFVNVKGGGHSGQAGAIRLGVARALLKANARYEPPLREKAYLTRDARVVERKKYGQRKARRRFQFSKR